MKKRNFTKSEVDFIKDNFNNLSYREMAQELNRHPGSIINKVKNLGLKKNYKVRKFTPDEIQQIIDLYPTHSFKDIAKLQNRSASNIRCKFRRLGLKRTPEQSEFVSKKYASKTYFKKNHLPANTLEKGAITVRHDKRTGNSYKYICLERGNWKEVHIVNWTKEHGPVPPGCCLRFNDGNTLNPELENLELISKNENLLRNIGREELTDKYIIQILSPRDKSLRPLISYQKELIELKRQEILLRRTINES